MSQKYYIAIDIGGTALKYGLVSDSGVVIESFETSVNFDKYATPMRDILTRVITEYYPQAKSSYPDIVGIGVSATGQIDSATGVVVGVGSAIKNYKGTEIGPLLTKLTGLPTAVLNDANAVALAEAWIGAGRGSQHMIAVTYGTGVGGGIITNGSLILGAQGGAGEIGHFSIKSDGIICSCGNQGCYECYASTRALSERVEAAIGSYLNGREIFARKDEEAIKTVMDAWREDVAKGLASLIHIFNPEIIVVGGGVSREKEDFIDHLLPLIAKYAMPNFIKELKIAQAELTNNAGMVGAAYFCKQQHHS